MASATVVLRVHPETRDRLKALAEASATTGAETLDRLVAREYEEALLAEMIEGMEQSYADPDLLAWSAYGR